MGGKKKQTNHNPSPKGASKPQESNPPAGSLNWPNLLAYVFIYTQKVTPEGEIQTHAWNTSLAGNSLLFPVLARTSFFTFAILF